jgi:Flp pilus assembly protein TadD
MVSALTGIVNQWRALVPSALWRIRVKTTPLAPEDQEALLRSLLRRFPTWPAGHRALSELALSADDIPLAYSSALLYERLARGSEDKRREALSLIGRCFLRRGDSSRALECFLQAQALGLQTPLLSEEIAAAHILQGDYAKANAVLQSISTDRLSAEGKAALSFVKDKCP